MQRLVVRFLLISGISYALLLGGSSEHIPVFRFAHQVIATLILGGWLIALWRSGRGLPPTPLDAPLFAAGIVWTAAALFARDPRSSLEYAWVIWVHILFFYLFVDLMRYLPITQRWIAESLFAFSAVVILIVGWQMIAWYTGLGKFAQSWPDLFGFSIPPRVHHAAMILSHNNPTAAYCLLMIPLALAGAITLPRRDLKWILRGIAGGLALVIVATQSRGGLIGLAALTGMIALLWLLRPETRARFPAILRPILAPRIVIPAAILVAAAGLSVGLWRFALHPANPTSPDVSRIDLWYSAVEMFEDHPVMGVGPRQFAAERLWYGHWSASYSNLPLAHAHSLYADWLAEGGIVGLAVGFWLAIRFGRTWWRAWVKADVTRRRRLEGVLVGVVAFAAHNLVDTFVQTRFMLLIMIMVAYMVSGETLQPQISPHPKSFPQNEGRTSLVCSPSLRFRRRLVWIALVALLVVQIIFLPLHRAAWAHQRTLNALVNDDRASLLVALDHNRTAQRFDPWQKLYVLQEATIRGHLAAADPDAYLAGAITAYENALDRSESWAQGWFNLSALYAAGGRYDAAIDAVGVAIAWDPDPARYFFQLGEYYLAVDDASRAYDAYFEALQRAPDIASSDIWLEPDRAAILDAMRIAICGTGPGFDLALYRGDLAGMIELARLPGGSPGLRARRDQFWLPDGVTPCPLCIIAVRSSPLPDVQRYLLWAERLLLDDSLAAPENLTAEQAARAAIFLDEGRAGWGWYVLARLALRGDLDANDAQIDDWLARSVRLPDNYNIRFSTTVYGLIADLDILPQARAPRISSQAYAPWLLLAERYESRAAWDEARAIYERLLEFAPHDRDIQARLDRGEVKAVFPLVAIPQTAAPRTAPRQSSPAPQ